MENQKLLASLKQSISTMPSRDDIPNNPQWYGAASAALKSWKISSVATLPLITNFNSHVPRLRQNAYDQLSSLIHEAIHDLEMKENLSSSTTIPAGKVFDFYKEVRKILQSASEEVFIVDPYLDATFVERYIPIMHHVSVQLLTSGRYKDLTGALQMYIAQNPMKVELKICPDFHDRFIFIDRKICFHSGASFKDGAVKTPASLIQMIDAFIVTQKIYEDLWLTSQTQELTIRNNDKLSL